MAAKKYSLKTEGGKSLSEHFKVSEFKCKDGSDSVLIDQRLVDALEGIRAALGGKPITILSAYRTEAYNTKCGGTKASQHLYGTAADIQVSGIHPKEVCRVAENVLASMGIAGGVGNYPYSFSHVDVRTTRARWQQDTKNGSQYNVSGFGGGSAAQRTLKQGDAGEDVVILQKKLGGLIADGKFGAKTDTKVREFQAANGLTADGVVGAKTWTALGK